MSCIFCLIYALVKALDSFMDYKTTILYVMQLDPGIHNKANKTLQSKNIDPIAHILPIVLYWTFEKAVRVLMVFTFLSPGHQ